MTCTLTKVAWIRDSGYPVGKPAPGRLHCPCGNAPESKFAESQSNVLCACGTLYAWNGYIISKPQVKQ